MKKARLKARSRCQIPSLRNMIEPAEELVLFRRLLGARASASVGGRRRARGAWAGGGARRPYARARVFLRSPRSAAGGGQVAAPGRSARRHDGIEGPEMPKATSGIPRAASANGSETMETIRGTARGRLPPGLRSDRADEGRRTCGCRSGRDHWSRRRTTKRPSSRGRSGSPAQRRARQGQVGATRDATVPRTRDTPHRCAGAPRSSSSCLSGRESRGSNTPGTSGRASMVERVAVGRRSGQERHSSYSSRSGGAQDRKSKKSRFSSSER